MLMHGVIVILVPAAICASVVRGSIVGPSDDQTNQSDNRPTGLATSGHPSSATDSWSPPPFSRYAGILNRMPFGQPPPPPPPPPPVVSRPPPPPIFASQLTLCAINRTLAGTVAVGLVDRSVTPPHNYYLDVGETENGLTVVTADFDAEVAVIEKEHYPVTLHLNSGPGAGGAPVVASEQSAIAVAANDGSLETPLAPPEAEPPHKQAFSSCTEQLLAMELSVPAGVSAPPLPYDEGMEGDVGKALNQVIVIEADDTEAVAALKENIGLAKEELRSHLQNGGSFKSYLQVLKDRREEEIARQKTAPAADDAAS